MELRSRRQTQSDATARIGVRPGTVNHWLYGDRIPTAKSRIRIFELYGVPITAWDRPVTRKKFEVPVNLPM